MLRGDGKVTLTAGPRTVIPEAEPPARPSDGIPPGVWLGLGAAIGTACTLIAILVLMQVLGFGDRCERLLAVCRAIGGDAAIGLAACSDTGQSLRTVAPLTNDPDTLFERAADVLALWRQRHSRISTTAIAGPELEEALTVLSRLRWDRRAERHVLVCSTRDLAPQDLDPVRDLVTRNGFAVHLPSVGSSTLSPSTLGDLRDRAAAAGGRHLGIVYDGGDLVATVATAMLDQRLSGFLDEGIEVVEAVLP